MRQRIGHVEYDGSYGIASGYMLHLKGGRSYPIGALFARPPALGLFAPPSHATRDVGIFASQHIEVGDRITYDPRAEGGWWVDVIRPDPTPPVTRCVAPRATDTFDYRGVGLYEARPRQADGVWTWRAVDWTETWHRQPDGRFQPRGYRTKEKWSWALRRESERLGLPILYVRHGQEVTR